jgi:hypothetical protein
VTAVDLPVSQDMRMLKAVDEQLHWPANDGQGGRDGGTGFMPRNDDPRWVMVMAALVLLFGLVVMAALVVVMAALVLLFGVAAATVAVAGAVAGHVRGWRLCRVRG